MYLCMVYPRPHDALSRAHCTTRSATIGLIAQVQLPPVRQLGNARFHMDHEAQTKLKQQLSKAHADLAISRNRLCNWK